MFILDEATSSVDTETEHLIQDALNKALKEEPALSLPQAVHHSLGGQNPGYRQWKNH